MRIDDLNNASATQGPEKSGQIGAQRTGNNAQGKEAVTGSDQASVSQLAQSLAAADPARIEQLRLQVESGNYEVPAQALAGAIIDAHVQE
jgi:flagellar biosynthesis anti-sigma factor FlgM